MGDMLSRRYFLRAATFTGGALYSVSAGSAPLSWGASHASVAPGRAEAQEQQEEVLEIPTSAYKKRVSNVQGELAKRDLGALVILSVWGATSGYDTRYLSQHWPGIVLVPAAGEPTLVAQAPIPPRRGTIATWIADVRRGQGWEQMVDQCADRLKELGLARGKIAIGGDFDWAVKMKFAAVLPGARFEEGNDIQDQLRLIKDEYEIKFMKRAGEIADAETRAAQRAIRPGRLMSEVVGDALRERYARGASHRDSLLFAFSSGGGSAASLAGYHHRIKAGEAIIYESIPYYGHYNVETPVTFAVGKVSAEQKALADLSFEAYQAGVAELKPGVPVLNAVKAAHAVISPKGYPEFTNGPGHFIGVGNIERPAIERDPGVVLKPGMTLSFHGTFFFPAKPMHWVGCCWLITEKGKEAFTGMKLEPLFQV